MYTEHIALADADLVESLCGVLEELVVVDELLGFGRDGGFAFDDGFEELDGHVAAYFEVDDVRVRLLGADHTDGDTPVRSGQVSWGILVAWVDPLT